MSSTSFKHLLRCVERSTREVRTLQHRLTKQRRFSTCIASPAGTLDRSRLETTFAGPNELKKKPPVNELGFGKHFTDHMLTIKWTPEQGWENPQIGPLVPFQMHPAAKVLHYAQELFEGMKAYRGVDDRIRMFRPMHNMARMVASAQRACLPTFDGGQLVECMRRLIEIEQEWVPHAESSSLYIRPTLIGTEPTLGVGAANEVLLFVILSPVGPYFASGLKPVNLVADPKFVRAWPGGCGYAKMGSNYAPTMWTQKMAEAKGCHQCLWLLGEDDEITEVGAMNIFVMLKKENSNDLELVTPPLDTGVILPGITRRSVIELTKDWDEFEVNERKLTMGELLKAKDEGRLVEMFGTGTAAIVSPVGNILYKDTMQAIPNSDDESMVSQRIRKAMSDIYYGRVDHPWAIDIESWPEQPAKEVDRLQGYQASINQHVASLG